jgi:hypothetical protein
MLTTFEPYLTLCLLLGAGALGGWLRHSFDEVAHRRIRPGRVSFILIGSTTACLAFALARPLFPSLSNLDHYYASLLGVGSLAGFWGLELYVRLVRRLPMASNGTADSWDTKRKEMNAEIEKLANGNEAKELQKRFPALVPFYRDLLTDSC